MESNINPVERVIIRKSDNEVLPVTATAFGQEEVIFTTSIGDITFSNIGAQGNLLNDEYVVEEVTPSIEPQNAPEQAEGVPTE